MALVDFGTAVSLATVAEWAETAAVAGGVMVYFCLMMETISKATRQALREGAILWTILVVFLWAWLGGVWAAGATVAVTWGTLAVLWGTCQVPIREVLGGRWWRAKATVLGWLIAASVGLMASIGVGV